ncbi:polysaccharide deacetylase [Methylocapsa sp. S129]|uniref:polysaccharide deacetylase family protein n=1 Tax=Methylocapsa sp. S129 TaxID=1641869 RepID=UPI00131D8A45|nr:polysaccharide deacetylase [Methylocapsa sp. S129]
MKRIVSLSALTLGVVMVSFIAFRYITEEPPNSAWEMHNARNRDAKPAIETKSSNPEVGILATASREQEGKPERTQPERVKDTSVVTRFLGDPEPTVVPEHIPDWHPDVPVPAPPPSIAPAPLSTTPSPSPNAEKPLDISPTPTSRPEAESPASCTFFPSRTVGQQQETRVKDYVSTFQLCESKNEVPKVAIRSMKIGGDSWFLLANPDSLTTKIEKAACWSCRPVTEDVLKETRLVRAIKRAAEMPGLTHRTFLENAGLVRGSAPGEFVTGDLCPSERPLDRRFFETLMSNGPGTPVALSISGLWLKNHAEDFQWLMRLAASGALDIIWVNHTYHHPYTPRTPYDETFMLTKNLNPEYEILETERLLIENGGTPSVFFRFPGLISSSALMRTVLQNHLISLGTDAWLAKGQKPRAGSIILVHPNGNEEVGLDLFIRFYSNGTIDRPLEPLVAAP